MGTFILLGVLIAAIAWPSLLISRLAQLRGYSMFGFYMLGPITAVTGGACTSYLLFPLLSLSPSSPKENESFLVNQAAVGLLAACILPWVVYFAVKVYRGKGNGLA